MSEVEPGCSSIALFLDSNACLYTGTTQTSSYVISIANNALTISPCPPLSVTGFALKPNSAMFFVLFFIFVLRAFVEHSHARHTPLIYYCYCRCYINKCARKKEGRKEDKERPARARGKLLFSFPILSFAVTFFFFFTYERGKKVSHEENVRTK